MTTKQLADLIGMNQGTLICLEYGIDTPSDKVWGLLELTTGIPREILDL
jgi:DNA-binding XRE family transcriptional regulator